MGSKRKEEIQTVIGVVGGGGREQGASSLNLDLWGLVGGISECECEGCSSLGSFVIAIFVAPKLRKVKRSSLILAIFYATCGDF